MQAEPIIFYFSYINKAEGGLVISGQSPDGELTEFVELPRDLLTSPILRVRRWEKPEWTSHAHQRSGVGSA